jgi:hypothetical protein
MARVPAQATAFAHRASRFMVNVAALYQRPEDKDEHRAWVDRFAAVLQDGDARVYVNFLGDEGQARVRQAYPGPTWERLAAVKARYDPTNLFHLNQNIPPPQVTPTARSRLHGTATSEPGSRIPVHRRGTQPTQGDADGNDAWRWLDRPPCLS